MRIGWDRVDDYGCWRAQAADVSWEALDREIGESGKDHGHIVAHGKLQPPTAFHQGSPQPSVLPAGFLCGSSFFVRLQPGASSSPPGCCSTPARDIPGTR